VTGPFLKN